MTQRLRPGIAEPVFLMFSRQQIETGDIGEPLEFLRGLTADPRAALDYCGRISLMVDGYNDDPREIFEISEVRAFIKASTRSGPTGSSSCPRRTTRSSCWRAACATPSR
jgi:hypothetical protein